jgi:hypothetical protein
MNQTEISLPPLDPDSLKARFKERAAATNGVYQNWQIRVHRSISWLKRATQLGFDQPEAKFLFMWISLNSLYSRWNAERNAPDGDTHAREGFLERLCAMDADLIAVMIHRHHGLVKHLLSDPYLSDVFWREPDHPKAQSRARDDVYHLDTHLKNHEYCCVMRQTTLRMFVLRGQIVHGASTGGSRLNRTSLRHCSDLLERLVPVILHIVIEHGANDDWPALCYPPQG